VQQLLVWLPNDARLYWLLAELYNAGVDRGPPDDKAAKFRKDKEIYQAFKIVDDLAGLQGMGYRNRALNERYHILREYVTQHNLAAGPQVPIVTPPDDPTASTDANKPTPFPWHTFFVGLGAGIVIGLFTAWQVRELRRRFAKARQVV
jgi:hypothetical protein